MGSSRPDEHVVRFVLGLLGTGSMLSELVEDLAAALPADSYPGEEPRTVVLDMLCGTVSTVLTPSDVADVERATELIGLAAERSLEHLQLPVTCRAGCAVKAAPDGTMARAATRPSTPHRARRVVVTGAFRRWSNSLDAERRANVRGAMDWIVAEGPTLGRPRVDVIHGSGLHKLKEARVMEAEERIAHALYRQGVSHDAVLATLDGVDEQTSDDERRDDLYLSALAHYVAALGGRLEVRAVFGS